jgi:hypothetical protein
MPKHEMPKCVKQKRNNQKAKAQTISNGIHYQYRG